MAPGRVAHRAARARRATAAASLAGVLNALEWVRANARGRNIRVVNLSFGTVPTGSLPDGRSRSRALLDDDPLAVATKALVDAGIFVVGAAGNFGQIDCAGAAGSPGAGSGDRKVRRLGRHHRARHLSLGVHRRRQQLARARFSRADDARAAFSSRGPAFPLQNAKPDLLAGGVGIESVAAPGSTLYQSASQPRLPHRRRIPDGLAAVHGAQRHQPGDRGRQRRRRADAASEPEADAEPGEGDPAVHGGGSRRREPARARRRFPERARRGAALAVLRDGTQRSARASRSRSGASTSSGATTRCPAASCCPTPNAWKLGVVWGTPTRQRQRPATTSSGARRAARATAATTSSGARPRGDNIVWGTSDGDNVVWGTAGSGDNIVWGTSSDGDNVVWGTDCGGQDCGGNIVWGTAATGDNIVWGTANDGRRRRLGHLGDGDNIVWGTNSDGDNIVWGTVVRRRQHRLGHGC